MRESASIYLYASTQYTKVLHIARPPTAWYLTPSLFAEVHRFGEVYVPPEPRSKTNIQWLSTRESATVNGQRHTNRPFDPPPPPGVPCRHEHSADGHCCAAPGRVVARCAASVLSPRGAAKRAGRCVRAIRVRNFHSWPGTLRPHSDRPFFFPLFPEGTLALREVATPPPPPHTHTHKHPSRPRACPHHGSQREAYVPCNEDVGEGDCVCHSGGESSFSRCQ